MSKLDHLRATVGANATDSMRVRSNPVGLPANPVACSQPTRFAGVSVSRDLVQIETGRIEPDPAQPREDFEPEALARLAESLKTRGQLQPIRVRWDEPAGVYRIVCGERRWRAAKGVGIANMSCVVVDRPMDAGELLAVQLVENALREDLKPVEQARAYRSLVEANGWSVRQLCRELSLELSSVSRVMSLLGLPESIQAEIDSGRMGVRTGSDIAKIKDPEEKARVIAEVAAAPADQKIHRADVAHVARRAGAKAPQRLETVKVDGGSITVKWDRGSESVSLSVMLSRGGKAARAIRREEE